MSSPKNVEKELKIIEKNEDLIKNASIIYNQKDNGYDDSYIKNVVDFKLLEEKCREYKNNKYILYFFINYYILTS